MTLVHSPSSTAAATPTEPLSVMELNRFARQALETHFPALLRVCGELSNLSRAASGHLYFTLKDEQAQIRCTMWRQRAQSLEFRPDNGMQVVVRARISLYEARGDFQLSVESLTRVGDGNLFEAFVRLKQKLAAEGLFDPEHKRILPAFPRRIGVLTSANTAAFQDVLASLRRRSPQLEVLLYPVMVQGDGAAAGMVKMLQQVSQRAKKDHVEVLLLVRGGGSLEDLYCFNDEALARAIAACPLPLVTGIGHETDFTIADFVADVRAPTPTAAAELVSAHYHALSARLQHLRQQLVSAFRHYIDMLAQRVDRAEMQLTHPRNSLLRHAENLQQFAQRLNLGLNSQLQRQRSQLQLATQKLAAKRPSTTLARQHLAELENRLYRSCHHRLQIHHHRLQTLHSLLAQLNPETVLARGYSITRNAAGQIVRNSTQLHCGDTIHVQLDKGQAKAQVCRLQSSHSPLAVDDSTDP